MIRRPRKWSILSYRRACAAAAPGTLRRGFTLLELLVTISIIGVLISVLLPAINAVRGSAKTLVCSSNLKSASTELEYFVQGLGDGQGDSRALGRNRFWITDFMDSLYGLDEFWDAGDKTVADLKGSESIMLCPAAAPRLIKRKGFPCGRESLSPLQDVSIAANMRLYRASFEVKGKRLLASYASTKLSDRLLDRPYVPLLLDVDAPAALAQGVDPFYIAPPIPGVEDPYASGRYWSPGTRHGGKTIVAFTGGHVLTSTEPGSERWDWAYQGDVGQ